MSKITSKSIAKSPGFSVNVNNEELCKELFRLYYISPVYIYIRPMAGFIVNVPHFLNTLEAKVALFIVTAK